MTKQDPPLISIIVPAFNVEKYLLNCVNSLLNQDYPKLEIIIIDDGSTDDTSKICKLCKEKDNRVKIIHQKNQGLSAARNLGIEEASGEYLAFVDGDDLVAPNFLSTMQEAAKKYAAEITICSFLEFTGQCNPNSTKTSDDITCVSGTIATTRLLVRQENRDIIVCNKLYQKDLFKDIKFPVGELHEDNLTTYKLLASASKVASIDKYLYYYRRHSGSITAEQNTLLRLKQKERAAKEAVEYFDGNFDLESAAEIALLLSKFAYLDNLAFGGIDAPNLWTQTVKEINDSRKDYKDNPFLTKKLKLYLKLLRVPGLYRLFRKIIH